MCDSKDSISVFVPELSDDEDKKPSVNEDLVEIKVLKEECVDDMIPIGNEVPIYFDKYEESIIKKEIVREIPDHWPKLEVRPGGVIKHIREGHVKSNTQDEKRNEIFKNNFRDLPLFSCGKCSENFTEIHFLVQHLKTHDAVIIKNEYHYENKDISKDTDTSPDTPGRPVGVYYTSNFQGTNGSVVSPLHPMRKRGRPRKHVYNPEPLIDVMRPRGRPRRNPLQNF